MTINGTRLTGTLVTLRDITPGDVDAIHAFCADPEVTQWSTWGPNTRAQTEAFVHDAVREAAAAAGAARTDRNTFTFAVVVKDRVVGTAGVWVTSAADRTGELGYTLRRDAWGQGLGTETAGLLLRHGFGPMGLERMEATCAPENAGSVRVLEKNGFAFEGLLRGHKKLNGTRRDSLLFAALLSDPARG